MLTRELLKLLGGINPAIYDIIPRGPQLEFDTDVLHKGSPQAQVYAFGARMAVEFSRMAWMDERAGHANSRTLHALEDICPSPPGVPGAPGGWPPAPDPDPYPWYHAVLHLGFAVQLEQIAGRLKASTHAKVLDKAIDRSLSIVNDATTHKTVARHRKIRAV